MKVCTRCQFAYYCSPDCQRAAWKIGHKQTCRKPSERKVGDQMYLKDLQKRGDLNGRLIWLVEPDGEDRWAVRVCFSQSDEEEANFSVGSDKLYHIRPARVVQFFQNECWRLMYNQGVQYHSGGDISMASASMWRAFQATRGSGEDGRAYTLDFYCQLVTVATHEHGLDISNNEDNLIALFQDKNATRLCRLVAVASLGRIHFGNDLEGSMEFYRIAMAIADSATEEELERQTARFSLENVRPIRDIIHYYRYVCTENVGAFTGVPPPFMEPVAEWLGIIAHVTVPRISGSEAARGDPELQTRTAAFVGGTACDFCHETTTQLGIVNFDKCGRYKRAYYCSTDCQRAAWKGGHEQACRKHSERKVGDLMSFCEPGSKTSPLVELVAQDEEDLDCWLVRIYLASGETAKTFSVKSDALTHIRPAK